MKDIAFHITDIAENCIRAGAGEINIEISLTGRELVLTVKDNGCGMSEETVRKVTDPFYTTRTTRRVGLGLPFLIQNAEQTGGYVEIDSKEGVGTKVKAVFFTDNIDCPPPGDLADTLMQIIAGNPSVNTVLVLKNGPDSYILSTKEISDILDGVPIGHPQVATLIKEMIDGNIAEIFDRKLNP